MLFTIFYQLDIGSFILFILLYISLGLHMKKLFLFALLLLPVSLSTNAFSQSSNNSSVTMDCVENQGNVYCDQLIGVTRSAMIFMYALENANQYELGQIVRRIGLNTMKVASLIIDYQNSSAAQRALLDTQGHVIRLFDMVSALDMNDANTRAAQEVMLSYTKDFNQFVTSSAYYIKFLQNNGK